MDKQISSLPQYSYIKDCYYMNESCEVMNINTGKTLKQFVGRDGYMKVGLMKKDRGTTNMLVHRLFMCLFYPVDGMEDLQVNHIDGIKTNNVKENLEWVTCKQNISHAWKNGLSKKDYLIGEKTNFNKYSEEDAKRVIELLRTNEYTDKEIHAMTGLPIDGFIYKIRHRETWKYLTDNIEGKLGKSERKRKDNRFFGKGCLDD